MAAADTARLIASLTLDAKGFTKGISKAQKDLGKLEGTAFRVGQNIGSGTKAAIGNIAKIGVVAAGGLTLAVKSGLDDLAELENAITSVDGAISQLGLTGQLSGKQIATWANEIEADVDAAFDDKAITQAATTLIRFGKVTPKNLRPALVVLTDLAAKTGDVDSAAELLSKALADPTKAAGKLSRQGIILTKVQQDTIKAMVEQNDTAGAQALLLDIVAKSTEGAAKAMAGPYQDAINKTNDALEDAKKALAIGFLPIITKVADKLSKVAADPKALASIESFGKTLAGGLERLIAVAEQLPWGAIGTSLEIGGMGAKAILDAFISLPPWVQTAVLTGWGLNKLTGGALGGIVSELGKGLIKGVLGINAGHVTVNAATVSGVGGGVAPVGGGAGKAAGLVNAVQKVFIVGAVAGIAFEVANVLGDLTGANVPDNPVDAIDALFDTYIPPLLGETQKGNAHLLDLKNKNAAAQQTASQLLASQERTEANTSANQRTAAQTLAANERNDAILAQKANEQRAAIQTFAASERAESRAQQTKIAAAAAASKEAGRATAAAIRDKDLSVSVNNTINTNVRVSVRETIDSTTTHKQYARYLS